MEGCSRCLPCAKLFPRGIDVSRSLFGDRVLSSLVEISLLLVVEWDIWRPGGTCNTQTPDIRFLDRNGMGICIDRGIEISSKLEFLSSATMNSMACLLLFRV